MTNPSKVYDTKLNINYSKYQPLSVNSHWICIKLWILHLRTYPNKEFIWKEVGYWSEVGSWNEVGSLN